MLVMYLAQIPRTSLPGAASVGNPGPRDIKSLTARSMCCARTSLPVHRQKQGLIIRPAKVKGCVPAIEGPGITVTLDDSPLWEQRTQNGDAGAGAGDNVNDYVVRQQGY